MKDVVILILSLLTIWPRPSDGASRALIQKGTCPKFSALSWHYPPYTKLVTDGKTINMDHSIMHIVLNELLTKCCNGNTSLSHHFTTLPGNEMVASLPQNISFAFPVSRNLDRLNADEKIPQQTFLPIIISPGAIYINYQPQGGYILQIFMQMWPLSILIVVATGFAGIIIWALDSRSNKDQFEPTFLRGFSDGIWWAFVSMTTVGYGDKTPRSVLGRLFGILWILVGICIISVFQSSITTSLNYIQQPLITIHNRRVSVIAGTEDYILALREGAIIQNCDGTECMYKLLEEMKISGFVVDYFVEKHARQMLVNKNYEFVSAYRINVPVAHGILMQGIPENLQSCFQYETLRKRAQVYEWLHALSTFSTSKDKYSSPSDVTQDILYLDGRLILIYSICTGILAFLIVILVIWDMKFRSYSKRRRASMVSHKKKHSAEIDMEGLQNKAFEGFKQDFTNIKEIPAKY